MSARYITSRFEGILKNKFPDYLFTVSVSSVLSPTNPYDSRYKCWIRVKDIDNTILVTKSALVTDTSEGMLIKVFTDLHKEMTEELSIPLIDI